jgi:hypothetical protein
MVSEGVMFDVSPHLDEICLTPYQQNPAAFFCLINIQVFFDNVLLLCERMRHDLSL